jgi:deazaflavin-dependent oxidoreductase (nitroreductase family)
MKEKEHPFFVPPNQPRWMLRVQVWMLRHHLFPMQKEVMALTTTGRKTGRKYTVPIGYVRDGDSYLGFNLMYRSNWAKNALANPTVMLNVYGRDIPARAEHVPLDTLDQVNAVLEVFRRELPTRFESYFKMPLKGETPEQLALVQHWIRFIRFAPV